MKYKSIAIPKPSQGQGNFGPVLVVPNQALSLEEILERFTRGEVLPIGKDVQYHESPDDLEKIAHSDLVDRQEYMQSLERTKQKYELQEKRKAASEKKRLEEEAIRRIIEEKAKANSQANSVGGSAK